MSCINDKDHNIISVLAAEIPPSAEQISSVNVAGRENVGSIEAILSKLTAKHYSMVCTRCGQTFPSATQFPPNSVGTGDCTWQYRSDEVFETAERKMPTWKKIEEIVNNWEIEEHIKDEMILDDIKSAVQEAFLTGAYLGSIDPDLASEGSIYFDK